MKLSFVIWVLAIFAFGGVNCGSKPNAPSPGHDCSTIIFSMADCLSFVSDGSKLTKPEGGCCSGLKTVLKTDAECLCETFKNSGQLGIPLNITKALTLPSACGVSTPPITKCGLSPSGGASPAQSPSATSPTSSKPVSAAPTPAPQSGNSVSQISAPAPSPSNGSPASSVSFAALFVSLVAAAWCSYN